MLDHQPVEAEVRHHGDGHELDAERERQDREDLVAVERLAALVDGEHAVAVPVEGDAEMAPGFDHLVAQSNEVGGAAADVDVAPVRCDADCVHLGTQVRERPRSEARERAVRAIDADSQTREIGAEALHDVVEVALACIVHALGGAAAADRSVEERLDLLLLGVGELSPVGLEELDAVVLGRVVRRGDDGPQVLGEKGDRRSRQDSTENRGSACRGDSARERGLELRPRPARVAPHEDAARAAPESRRLSEPLDEVGRQVLPDNTANPVGPEVAPRHGGGTYLLENCGALRALCRPAFLRSTMRASRVRKPWRLRGTRSSGSASTRARATPCLTAPA